MDLGKISFTQAWARQEETVRQVAGKEAPETVFLLEHPHVFTIGRVGLAENLLAEKDWDGNPIELVRINRGGDVTYHGPGQLVGYPHLDLRERGRDVHYYLRSLEESLIRTAARFGIEAYRRDGLTGVWTDQGKLAAIGVGVRHWITMHGFALNVTTDLRYFQFLNPCGIAGCPVTSLSLLLARPVTLDEVKPVYRECFEEIFNTQYERR